jgi:hypothetical protein
MRKSNVLRVGKDISENPLLVPRFQQIFVYRDFFMRQ